MKLVASLIVRNELSRYLDLCIEHLLGYCDEIRVLDDGSDDGTFEWLGGLRAPVFVIRNPGPSFYEFESKARNALLEFTMRSEPDYVLSIDADEFVGDPSAIAYCLQKRHAVYSLEMSEVWQASQGALQIRMDGRWPPRPCPILWSAPRQWSQAYEIPERKLACGREPGPVRRTPARRSGSSIYHFGWANEAERIARAERYTVHDHGQFHADAHLQSILWPPEMVRLRAQTWPDGLSDVRDRLVARAGGLPELV